MSNDLQQLAEDDFLGLSEPSDQFARGKTAVLQRYDKLQPLIPEELATNLEKLKNALPILEKNKDFPKGNRTIDVLNSQLDEVVRLAREKQAAKTNSIDNGQTATQKLPQERIEELWEEQKEDAVAVARGKTEFAAPMLKAIQAYSSASKEVPYNVRAAAQAVKQMQLLLDEANSSTPEPKKQPEPVTKKPDITKEQWESLNKETADLVHALGKQLQDQYQGLIDKLNLANKGTTYTARFDELTKLKAELVELEQTVAKAKAESQQLANDTGQLLSTLSGMVPKKFTTLPHQKTASTLAKEADPLKKRDGLQKLKTELQQVVKSYGEAFDKTSMLVKQELDRLAARAKQRTQAMSQSLEQLRATKNCEAVVELRDEATGLESEIESTRRQCDDVTAKLTTMVTNIAGRLGRAADFQDKLNPLASLVDVDERKQKLEEFANLMKSCKAALEKAESEAAELRNKVQAGLKTLKAMVPARYSTFTFETDLASSDQAADVPTQKSQLSDLHKSVEENIKKLGEAFQKQYDGLQEKLNVLRGEAASRVQGVETKLAKANQNKNIDGAGGILELREAVKSLENETAQEKTECNQLALEVGGLIANIAGPVDQTADFQNRVQTANGLQDVFARRAAIQQVRSDLEQLQQQIDAATLEFQQGSQAASDLLQEVRAMSAIQLTQLGYQETFNSLANLTNPFQQRDDLQKLKAKLEVAKRKFTNDANTKLSEQKDRIDNLASRVIDRLTPVRETYQQLAASRNLDDMTGLDSDLDALESDVNDAEATYDTAESESPDLISNVASHLGSFQEFKDRFTSCRSLTDVFAKRDEMVSIRDTLKALKQPVEQARATYASLSSQTLSLFREVEEMVLSRFGSALLKEYNTINALDNVIDKHAKMTEFRRTLEVQKQRTIDTASEAVKAVSTKPAELQAMTTKAKIDLIEQLAQGPKNTKSARDEALKTVWESIEDLEPEFEQEDKKRRNQVLTALSNSKELADARDEWEGGEMTVQGKLEVLETALKLQCAQLFDDNPQFAHLGENDKPKPPQFALDNKAAVKLSDTETLTEQGNFDPKDGKIHFNQVALKDANFTEALDTVIHENTHHYQHRLVKLLEEGKLKEGSPEYDQARLFALNFSHYVAPPKSGDEEDAHRTQKVYKDQPVEMHAWRAGTETRNLQFPVPTKARLDKKESRIIQRANPIIQRLNRQQKFDEKTVARMKKVQEDAERLKNATSDSQRKERLQVLNDYDRFVTELSKM